MPYYEWFQLGKLCAIPDDIMTNANIKIATKRSVEPIREIASSRAMSLYKKKTSVLLVVWFPYFGLRQSQAIEHNRPPNNV